MCLLLIGTVSPAIADLDGIQILSEQYHVEGAYEVQSDWDWSWHSDSYNLDSTNSSGISGSVSYTEPYEFAVAESSAGQFFANAYAYSSTGPEYAYSYATASLSFQPMTSGWLHAEFSLWSYMGEDSHAILSDSTADVQLFESVYEIGYFQGDWWIYDTHLYSLSLWAFGSQGIPGSGASAELSFTPIPAPGALILAGIGVSCIHWLRRRRTL
jgi:hypothetical protein